MAKKFSDVELDEVLSNIEKFTREPSDDWNKSSYSVNVSCQNCGNSCEVRIGYSESVKTWAKSQRCPNCAHKGTFVKKFD